MSTEQSTVAWVIGGGTGIGRGAAEALAATGRTVVVSGRREAEIAGVVTDLEASGSTSVGSVVVDVSDAESVRAAHETIVQRFGPVGILVFSAGTNVPNRYWENGDPEDFARITDVNLTGAVRAIHTVLPGMREREDGVIILISSWAGWRFVPMTGAAYTASKRALGGLAETLNHQEGRSGIRATHLCPADVATDILNRRPVVPTEDQQATMLTRADLGDAVRWIASLPPRVCVNELVISPTVNANYGHFD